MDGKVRRRKIIGRAPKAARLEEAQPSVPDKPPPVFKPRSRMTALGDFLGVLGALAYLVWLVYNSHAGRIPQPKDLSTPLAEFSEARAMRAVKEITGMGGHEFGSMILEYVTYDTRRLLELVQRWELPQVSGADLELEWQVANASWVDLQGGLFHGKTVAYDSLQNLLCRISPSHDPQAKENAILVSTHLDAIKFTEGAGDSASSAGVMVELVRNLMYAAQGHRNAVIFLWNTGEEEGLMGAHAFMTQHPWAQTVRAFVDLEAMGVGGKSSLFQAGPTSWLLEQFCQVAPHPSALIVAQDVFRSGLVGSATDFQVYRKIGGLSGLDFAYMEQPGAYHTRFDSVSRIRNGSLQHLGDNMLALLKHVANSPELANQRATPGDEDQGPVRMQAIYFDVLGKFMLVISAHYAQAVYLVVIAQSAFYLAPVITHPKYGDPRAFLLSLLSLLLAFLLGLLFPLAVACLLPFVCYHPIPCVANPWLAIGLFGAPAIAGALMGQGLGHSMLVDHIETKKRAQSEGKPGEKRTKTKGKKTKPAKVAADGGAAGGETEQQTRTEDAAALEDEKGKAEEETNGVNERASGLLDPSSTVDDAANPNAAHAVAWEAERWLYRSGFLLWLALLAWAAALRLGSAYLAFVWLVSPALAYRAFTSSSSDGSPSWEMKWGTLILGMMLPLTLTAESAVRLPSTLIVLMARADKNPGELGPWVPNAAVALVVGFLAIAFLVYMLPFAHRSGATQRLVGCFLLATAIALGLVVQEEVSAFGPNAPRPLAVVSTYPDLTELQGQRVNWRQLARDKDAPPPLGVITVASLTPGALTREVANLTGMACGRGEDVPDLVTLTPLYACTAALQLGTNVERSRLHETVTELEVLSDTGPGALGAASWREGLRWWVPPPPEEEVVDGELGGRRRRRQCG